MILGIDGMSFKDNFDKTGIGGFVVQLVNGLTELNFDGEIILFVNKKLVEYTTEILPNIKIVGIECIQIRKIRQIALFSDLSAKIKNYKIDLLIDPYARLGGILKSPCKRITVVHDLHYKYYPDYYGTLMLPIIKQWLKRILLNSDKIVSISQWTKKDLLEDFPMLNNTIAVIGNAVEMNCNNAIKKDSSLKYVLSVNSFTPWKNQITLIKAFNKIKNIIPHNLILIGGGNPHKLNRIIEQFSLEDRVFIKQNVSDEAMYYFYKNAALFVNTSLFEGFGRGNIEAALLEVPVLSSKCMCLEECSFGLLNYYDPPKDDDALAKRIIEVLNSNISETTLKAIKSRFSKEYSKQTIASKYLDIIKLVGTKS